MPDLAVVIPTVGRPAELARVLAGLEKQTIHAARFEVIVVADAEHPDPEKAERGLADRPYRTVAIRAEDVGASAARNRGWQASSAPIVLFLGDDILPSRHLVAEHLEWHRREPLWSVGVLGHVRWARELKLTPFMRWLERGMQFDFPSVNGIDAGWGRFYTANASVKRTLVKAVGGFDEQRLPYLYEDLDLAYRMHLQHGFRLLYNRRALGDHLHHTDLRSWRARMTLVAAAERAFVAKHPEIPPYFERMFRRAMEKAPARGRGAQLVRYVPGWMPWLGARVWASADLYFRQQLAPSFLKAWDPLDQSRDEDQPEAARQT